jgi:hypothetical protein
MQSTGAETPDPVSVLGFFLESLAFGLSGFEEEATLRIWNLVESPEERGGQWNCARPGAPAQPESSAVVLAQPPSIEDLFGGAEAEIASEPPGDLPAAPDEPK